MDEGVFEEDPYDEGLYEDRLSPEELEEFLEPMKNWVPEPMWPINRGQAVDRMERWLNILRGTQGELPPEVIAALEYLEYERKRDAAANKR